MVRVNNDVSESLLAHPPGEDGRLPSLVESPELERGAHDAWRHVQNLDAFFLRLYQYYQDKGFFCTVVSRVLNLASLAFTVGFSAFLLLYVDWNELMARCGSEKLEPCDVVDVALLKEPMKHHTGLHNAAVVLYLLVFSLYWLWSLLCFLVDLRPLLEMRYFCNAKLAIAERDMATLTWSELVDRIVHVQATTRLCIVRDLSAHDIVSRIMRKENYLIGMFNKDVLDLTVDLPGLRGQVWFTKAIEWNLYWSVLDNMFDDNFVVREDFYNEAALARRFRWMALLNLAVSPFIAVFLFMNYFLSNAENFYRHPSVAGARSWSAEAHWKVREFNELPHFLELRLNQGYKKALVYITQFPSPVTAMVAKFVVFVFGGFAAVLIALAFIDERLLQADLNGRNLLWYSVIFGTILAVTRALVPEDNHVFAPEHAMQEVVEHTHFLPRHWRTRCHTAQVQREFGGLFQLKPALFVQEMLSVFVAPYLLYFKLPKCCGDITAFVRNFTVHVEGVGDVCSLAAFNFANHGNSKYGSPTDASKAMRSRQGKMEKSFLSFVSNYPGWEPDASGQHVLASLQTLEASEHAGGGGGMTASVSGVPCRLSGSISGGHGVQDSETEAQVVQRALQRFYVDSGGGTRRRTSSASRPPRAPSWHESRPPQPPGASSASSSAADLRNDRPLLDI